MELHISRSLRARLDLHELVFSYTGNVIFGNVAACRKLALQLNAARRKEENEAPINAGLLFAVGLIDELSHALVKRYRKEIDPDVLSDAIGWFAARFRPEEVNRLLLTFTEHFPNVDIYQSKLTASEWLEGSTEGLSNREAAFEELLLLWLANINPACKPFRDLFEDEALRAETKYQSVTSRLDDYFVTRPLIAPKVGTLLDALRAPMLASPDSLKGQLDFIREHWAQYLGENLNRVLLAIDVITEEDVAIWMRFHPPSLDRAQYGEKKWEAHGFAGDEYVGFDEDFVMGPDGVRRPRRYASDHQAPLNEYEAFSPDQAWMPTVVMMAKSTYVWLEQLSNKYGRHIHRLDQIPDEELRLLSNRGMTALWLIGLWERSTASQTIKRLRGQSDAVASAYSLKEYRIADDLGGNSAYESLRDRAAAFGVRLASDMVPNHMGIDSTWVIEHPEWFVSRPDSPFPVYTFEGPDLSTDGRVEIKIEDHYYEQTDAAVTFRLRNYRDGSTRFVYHGNDGTTFAWNDTAQIDYSKSDVREQVIQTILHVARLFPIIRFDAAMTLAKRHVQRLWFPLPGVGGSIPSRAEAAMSQEQFDALMPNEFWREVVDRVAVEVPGTLLLAEAFWLLEGYFVRTLGMHRVYNSAFMNMLRDQENAKYRSYLKKTLEFDPDILKRYVNFMSNPDERTAVDQFGTGDKYFGVCTMLATLPGLPMFAHGQIEGLTERYGMDFKQARLQEKADEDLAARHQRDIAPLLKNRRLFAESANFVFYDFWTEHGAVDENVFAYSNRLGHERAVVLYNNAYESTRGTIHGSVAYMDKGSGNLVNRSLIDGLALSTDGSVIVSYRDRSRGVEYLRRATDLQHNGLSIDLRGYEHVVFEEWRERYATADQPWDKLCDALSGAGVHNLDEALALLQLRPLHHALRETITEKNIRVLARTAETSHATVVTVRAPGALPDKEERVPAKPVESKAEMAPADTTSATNQTQPLDPKLQEIVAKAEYFLMVAEEAFGRSDTIGTHPLGDDLPVESSRAERMRAGVAAAAQLPLLVTNLKSAEVLRFANLTATRTNSHPERLWAPVLAWAVLRELPGDGDRSRVFDHLHVRTALADIFSCLSIEGDDSWRAAARVRVLLVMASSSFLTALASREFWNDADVRWLTGVNESFGIYYLNKEAFEELVGWMQLPRMFEIAQKGENATASMKEVESELLRVCAAAQQAGYNLESFLKVMEPELIKADVVKPSVVTLMKTEMAPADEALAESTVDKK